MTPPTRKKKKVVNRYMIAIFLWSTVVNQPRTPFDLSTRAKRARGSVASMTAIKILRECTTC